MIELGSKVRDSVTGFEGLATKRMETWQGTPQVAVERGDATSSPEEKWFVEGRLAPADDKPAVGITANSAPPTYERRT